MYDMELTCNLNVVSMSVQRRINMVDETMNVVLTSDKVITLI